MISCEEEIIKIFEHIGEDLRELAHLVGADPATFYQFTCIDGLDVTGQDLRGMKFYNFDPKKIIFDEDTILPIPDISDEEKREAQFLATGFLAKNLKIPKNIALNVRELDLSETKFRDISLLKACKFLQKIRITRVLDERKEFIGWPSISKCIYLQWIFCSETNFEDLALLKDMANLSRLSLCGTLITDLSPISELSGLQVVSFDRTQIGDLSGLTRLDALNTVWARKTNVVDWRPVKHVKFVLGRPRPSS